MADWKSGLSEKELFFNWVTYKYGWLRAQLLQFSDWQNSAEYFRWVKQERPAPVTPPTRGAVTPETTPPTETPPTETPPTPVVTQPYQWAIPGQVVLDPNTNKYYYTGGATEIPATNIESLYAEISLTQLADLQRQYTTATTPTTPTPDWQEAASAATLAESKRQFDITQTWQKEQTNLANIKEQFDMELQFEKDRDAMLRGLPSDDWIKRYVLQNQPNPYKDARLQREWTEKQGVGSVDSLGQTLDTQTATVQSLQNQLVSLTQIRSGLPEGSPAQIHYDKEITRVTDELAGATTTRDTTYKTWNTIKQENVNWTPQGVPQPYPNAPGWLPTYAPGTVGGQMITKQNVVTPSGQQLTQMPTSQAGQLGAYADWAADYTGARQWRDILGEAQLMQPKTPFSGTRWSPAGARV